MVRRGSRTGPLRSGVDATERARVAVLLGVVVADADAALVLDPRGREFQRLEWQGDSALDAVVALHRWGGPACCARAGTADLVSDQALAARAARVGLVDLLDWRPDADRLADCVETCVGAGWHVSEQAAATVTSRLVHDEVTVTDVTARPDAADVGDSLRCDVLTPPAHVGAAVMEAAAADHLIADATLSDADEGELSRARGRLLDGQRVLEVAGDSGWLPGCGGQEHRRNHRNHLLDHVQARVGLVAVTRGLRAGLVEADRLW